MQAKTLLSRPLELTIFLAAALCVVIGPLKFGVPFVASTTGFLPVALKDWLSFPWPVECYASLTAGFLILCILKAWVNRAIRLPDSLLIHLLFYMTIITTISLYNAYNTYRAVNTTLQLISSFALLGIFIALPDKKRLFPHIMALLITVAGLIALYGLYQYFIGLENTREYVRLYMNTAEMPEALLNRISNNRVFSTFVYANSYGGYLTLALPVTAAYFFLERELRAKIANLLILNLIFGLAAVFAAFLCTAMPAWFTFVTGIAGAVFYIRLLPFFLESGTKPTVIAGGIITAVYLAISLYAFILTRSQGSHISLILGSIAALILLRPFRAVYMLGTVALLSAAGGLYLAFSDQTLPMLAEKVFKLSSLKVRLEYWQAALAMIRDHRIIGVGPGNFGEFYAKYMLPGAEETQMAHNNFLQMWAECGSFMFVTFSAFWVLLLVQCRTIIKQAPGSGKGLAIMFAGLVSFIIHNMVDFDFYIPGLIMTFGAVVILILSFENQHRHTISLKGIWGHLACIIMIVLLLAVPVFSGRLFYGKQLFSTALLALKAQNGALAVDYLAAARKIIPSWPDIYFHEGNIAQVMGDRAKAKEKYVQAASLSPGSAYYVYVLARLYQDWPDIPENKRKNMVLHYINMAVDRYPTHLGYLTDLARAYSDLGKEDAAAYYYTQVLRYEPSNKEARKFVLTTLISQQE